MDFLNVLFSTLIHLPLLRSYCVGGYWYRTTMALAFRRSDLFRSTTKNLVSHSIFLSHITMFRSSITTGVGHILLAAGTRTTKPVRFVNSYPLHTFPMYSMSGIKVQ